MELIRACAESGDGAAWVEFIRRFNRPICLSITRVAQRWRTPPQECVDDLAQDTYLKLCADRCRKLHQFTQAHPESIEAYVRTIAVNVANDFFKALHSIKRGGGEVQQLAENMEPGAPPSKAGGAGAIQREVLLREIESCLSCVADNPLKKRDLIIFWLYYKQGFTAEKIASIPSMNLNVKGVESLIHRLTRLIRSHLAKPSGTSRAPFGPQTEGLEPPKSFT